jgi:hypothetical protein
MTCATLLFEFLSNGELRLLLFHINRCYGICKHGEVAIDLSRQGLDVLVAGAAAVAVRAVAAVVRGVRLPPDQFRRTVPVHEIHRSANDNITSIWSRYLGRERLRRDGLSNPKSRRCQLLLDQLAALFLFPDSIS